MRHIILSATIATVAFAASPLDDKGRPVASDPSRTPAETAAMMKVPPGFKVQVVTSEPDVVQPIAMTQDDRGRLWVLTNTNYPVWLQDRQDMFRFRAVLFAP